MSTSEAASTKQQQQQQPSNESLETTTTKVPVTLLSGFLGSGKTSTLQHLLENTDGLRIGVIVNDMASVNIDAKLVSAAGKSNSGILELQNGCACCSLADELLTTVDTLLESRSSSKQKSNKDSTASTTFDALVVELSGVADPVAIQTNWNTAKLQGHPVTKKAQLQRVVTLVDASTFGTDWMSWDQAGDRDGWVDPADECAANRKVPELLAEQVEAADVILINKIDLAGPKQVQVASALARTINQKALMEEVEFGRVTPLQILGKSQHKATEDCEDPQCKDPSHSHSHKHSHSYERGAEMTNAECNDVDCTDPSHSHSHSHEHSGDAAACNDPDCTDPSHGNHEHSHSHAIDVDNLGIVNFVYRADRPFNAKKLIPLLSTWPVPIKDDLDLDLMNETLVVDGYAAEGTERGPTSNTNPFVGVLRSKGFCWLAPTKWSGPGADVWRHDTAMYWSHAGKHFGITAAGKWWGTIPKDQMKKYFKDDPAEYERILSEDFVSEEFGDRRQELVFIGVQINQEEITDALNSCLLGEKGMERYRQELNNYMNTILTAPAGGAGLFDVGRVDHMDVE
ncbi:CobW/hypB/UreG, nucleotide-binding domain containing protein [Nitzschia inconspicua]|uniref:CobW/hypB/UreG, nucleotide-binding domain containing protein n=1 Tax=Nitzschia inconspicua TaxID=303405 RepID=A0A9K3KUM9_9STRA|nr:CobW/hypB/UreG, nucleotide-binding domain containing protein [Nitzschia inconspicua]